MLMIRYPVDGKDEREAREQVGGIAMISNLTGYFRCPGGFWTSEDTEGCIEGKMTPLNKVLCILVYVEQLTTLSLEEFCLMVLSAVL